MALPAELAYGGPLVTINRVANMVTPLARRKAEDAARSRARRRAEGLTAIEAVLHRDDVASLDELKAQIGAVSRSEVLRVLIAKVDRATLSPADLTALSQGAA